MWIGIAVALVAIVAPFMRALAWMVPVNMFSLAMGLRAAIEGAIPTAFFAWAATYFVDARVAGAVGLVAGLFIVLNGARRHRFQRGAAILSLRVADPSTRSEALSRLRVLNAKAHRSLTAKSYSRLALFSSRTLCAIDKWEEADALLEKVESGTEQMVQAKVTTKLHLGKFEECEKLLQSIPRPAADKELESWLSISEALLASVQGGVERAKEHLGELPDPADVALRASHRVVRSHVAACEGDDALAESELLKIQEEAGETALHAALHPVGPATDIARKILQESAALITSVNEQRDGRSQ